MTTNVDIARRAVPIPVMSARKRFKGYQPEAEKASRKMDIRESEGLEQIRKAWRAFSLYPNVNERVNYEAIVEIVKKLQYTKRDIERFNFALGELQHEDGFSKKAGFFLSALMNKAETREFIIVTQFLATPIDCLGMDNEKNIIVNGDLKGIVGSDMICGSITVHGNVEDIIGGGMKSGSIIVHGSADRSIGWEMEGGSITIIGDVGDTVGYAMKGGTVTVHGNAGTEIGEHMEGGDIHINGDIGSIGNVKGGKIYHIGKLVVDK
jgi:hypothetical protein